MSGRALLPLALLACAGLALTNWLMAQNPVDISPIAAPGGLTPAADPTGGAGLPARNIDLVEAIERPLFAADRKPWAAPKADPVAPPLPGDLLAVEPVPLQAAPAQPPAVTLAGIQKTPKGAVALLADQTGAPPVWLREGEAYLDWRVENITAVSADLSNGGSKVTLQLYPPLPTGPMMP